MICKPFFTPPFFIISPVGKDLSCGCVFADIRLRDGAPAAESGTGLAKLLSDSLDRKIILNITDASCSCIDPVCSLIAEAGAEDRVLIASPHARVLRRARAVLPSCASALSPGEALCALLLSKAGLLFLRKKLKGDALILPEYAGGIRLLSVSLIRELRAKGVAVIAWGVDRPDAALRLLDAGAAAVITGNADVIEELQHEKKE